MLQLIAFLRRVIETLKRGFSLSPILVKIKPLYLSITPAVMFILLKKVFPTFDPQIKVSQIKATCIYCVELKWRILMCQTMDWKLSEGVCTCCRRPLARSAWEAIKRAIFVQFLSHVLWCNFCCGQVVV